MSVFRPCFFSFLHSGSSIQSDLVVLCGGAGGLWGASKVTRAAPITKPRNERKQELCRGFYKASGLASTFPPCTLVSVSLLFPFVQYHLVISFWEQGFVLSSVPCRVPYKPMAL